MVILTRSISFCRFFYFFLSSFNCSLLAAAAVTIADETVGSESQWKEKYYSCCSLLCLTLSLSTRLGFSIRREETFVYFFRTVSCPFMHFCPVFMQSCRLGAKSLSSLFLLYSSDFLCDFYVKLFKRNSIVLVVLSFSR